MGKHLIIAGHGKQPAGSIDYGAEGNGYKENNLTKELVTLMDAYVDGECVFLTDHDVYGYREMANYKGYDSITEVHFNAYNTQAHGCEVLIHPDYAADAQDNRLLAVLSKYFFNRGIKKRSDLYNLNVCKSLGYNYRLIEVCFIDNAADMKVYTENKKTIAKQLVEAITGQVIAEPSPVVDGSLYRVQVGAYKSKANADKMKEKLKTAGFEALVVKG